MDIGGETIKWERRPSMAPVGGISSRVMDHSYMVKNTLKTKVYTFHRLLPYCLSREVAKLTLSSDLVILSLWNAS